MQIRAEQLRNNLKNRQLPLYMVCGEEPLQHKEAVDMLRKAAKYYAYEDREVYTVETGFDWDMLARSANTLSLFANKKLIELHLPTAKPGAKGASALISYCENPPEDTILLIIAGKLEGSAKKTKWYKALDKSGAIVQVWPIEGKQLNVWLNRRLQSKGLKLQSDAVQLINDRIEGNLLAADQEIEKLSLLYPASLERKNSLERTNSPERNKELKLDREQVAEAVFDSARFNVFELFDNALSGDIKRAARMLTGLQHEGMAIMLILALIAKEVRMLAKMSAIAQQQGVENALKSQYFYSKRRGLIVKALKDSSPRHWQDLLQKLLEADKMAKGMTEGDPWELMQLVLAEVANKPYLIS
jgi:DNA polymerase-3 subunit delta